MAENDLVIIEGCTNRSRYMQSTYVCISVPTSDDTECLLGLYTQQNDFDLCFLSQIFLLFKQHVWQSHCSTNTNITTFSYTCVHNCIYTHFTSRVLRVESTSLLLVLILDNSISICALVLSMFFLWEGGANVEWQGRLAISVSDWFSHGSGCKLNPIFYLEEKNKLAKKKTLKEKENGWVGAPTNARFILVQNVEQNCAPDKRAWSERLIQKKN